MAKGDFVFAGIDTTSHASAALQSVPNPDRRTAGLTIVFLFVTVELSKFQALVEDGVECACLALISDYSLQVNAYGGNDVRPGEPAALNTAHELYHVRAKQNAWTAKKAELDKLLTDKTYACDDDSAKSLVVQDIVEWMRSALFGQDEETGAEAIEQDLKDKVNTGKTTDQYLDAVFGKTRLKENPAAARSEKDLLVKGRFSSRVIISWAGSCQ